MEREAEKNEEKKEEIESETKGEKEEEKEKEEKKEKEKVKEKVEKKPPELERVYIVPLRREWLKAPYYKRSKKAVKALKEFVTKHMKADNVLLDKELNEFIWQRGIRRPPAKIKIKATKEASVVKVSLFKE